MAFFVFIGFIVLLLLHLRLRDRVQALEERVGVRGAAGEVRESAPASSTVPPAAQTSPVVAAVPSVPAPDQFSVAHTTVLMPPPPSRRVEYAPAAAATESPAEFFLVAWFKEQPLIKIGAILFFLGAVWFVGYAISEGWLPPQVQIALGYVLAGVAYGAGVWRARSNETQYLVLTTLGTGIAIATTYAGQNLFNLFPPAVALLILCLSIAYTVWVSVVTRTEWLAVSAVVAGLVAPLLVNETEPEHFMLLAYLLAVAAGFSAVVLLTQWRLVTLVSVGGVYLYQLGLLGHADDNLLWFFVVLSSALFFSSITTSMARTNKVVPIDVVSLGIVGVLFSVFASYVALSDSLALFVATLVVAGTGYALRVRGVDESVQSVLAGFALGTLLMGTTFLFSGYQLAVAYAVEIFVVFCLLTYLGVRPVVRRIASWAFALPIATSLPAFSAPVWQAGILHGETFVVLLITAMLFGVSLWCLEHPRVQKGAWAVRTAGIFGVIGYVYAVVVSVRLATGLSVSVPADAEVIAYMLWGVLALALLWFVVVRRYAPVTIGYVTAALSLPYAFSLGSLAAPEWTRSVLHPDAIGMYSIFILLVMAILMVGEYYKQSGQALLRTILGTLLLATLGYGFLIIARFWYGIFADGNLAYVAMYTTYALVLYLIVTAMVSLRIRWAWVQVVLFMCVLPGVLSIASFLSDGWRTSAVHPDAIGLYVCATIALVLAIGIYGRRHYYPEVSAVVATVVKILFIVSGLYAFGLVWFISGALASSAVVGVVAALFIYSVCGLACYSYGRIYEHTEIKYAGIVLLSAVVARLALVDVWVMETLWRIVTFLGIGVLFIATSLFEKPFKKANDTLPEVRE